MKQTTPTEPTLEQRKKEIELFLKEAFCIDGECELFSNSSLFPPNFSSQTFVLHDSNRGTFYVTLSTKTTST